MQRNKQAFTLIELLVVVLIIGILAAVAVPQYKKAVEKSRLTEMLTLMDSLEKGASVWFLQNDVPEEQTGITSQLDIDVSGFSYDERLDRYCTPNRVCIGAQAYPDYRIFLCVEMRKRSGNVSAPDYVISSDYTPSTGWVRRYASCYVNIDSFELEQFGYTKGEC